jgi:pre-mRNA-processing factor 40
MNALTQVPPHPHFATAVAATQPGHLPQQQQPLGISTNTPSTAQLVDQAWTEHTAQNGAKFYYNEILKDSTWTKPAVLIKEESGLKQLTVSNNSLAQKRTWQEYADTSTGRKYYSDGVTTTWDKPDGFVSPDDIVARTSAKEEKCTEPTKKKKRASEITTSDIAKNELISFGSKQEAVAAFKGLLLAKGVAPALKWNEVVKLCESDTRWRSRWEACSDVLSIGERRQALAEYQTKRANEIRNEERQERARSKEAFGQMLADILPKNPVFSSHTSRFEDVRPTLAKDDRFFAIDDESLRETLFLDFCDDFKKREERKKRSKKKEATESFVLYLHEKEEAGLLTFASTWESFLSSLTETEKADIRFATSVVLPDSDRQLYFADFVLELQKAEDDKRRRIRDARRRAEKAQRDNFRDFLRTQAREGNLLPNSRWRAVEELLTQHESFALVLAQGRDTPRELFEEFAEEWDESYRHERSFLARLVEQSGDAPFIFTRDTTFESFKNIIIKEASYSDDVQDEACRIISREDPVSSARLFYDELASRSADNVQYISSRQPEEESSEDEGEIKEGEEDDNRGNVKENEVTIDAASVSSSEGLMQPVQDSTPVESDQNESNLGPSNNLDDFQGGPES